MPIQRKISGGAFKLTHKSGITTVSTLADLQYHRAALLKMAATLQQQIDIVNNRLAQLPRP